MIEWLVAKLWLLKEFVDGYRRCPYCCKRRREVHGLCFTCDLLVFETARLRSEAEASNHL